MPRTTAAPNPAVAARAVVARLASSSDESLHIVRSTAEGAGKRNAGTFITRMRISALMESTRNIRTGGQAAWIARDGKLAMVLPFLGTQSSLDILHDVEKTRIGAQFGAAVAAEIDGDVGDDSGRPAGEENRTLREECGFENRVGNEQDGHAGVLPKRQELLIETMAG